MFSVTQQTPFSMRSPKPRTTVTMGRQPPLVACRRALLLHHQRRLLSRRFYHELSYRTTGEPAQVLSYHYCPDSDAHHSPTNHYCKVQLLHAPFNPADINLIQGRYASPYNDKSSNSTTAALVDSLRHSHAFPGYTVACQEGVGQISEFTQPLGGLKIDDYVVVHGIGTARSSLWAPASFVIPIRRGPELFSSASSQQAAAASTLFQLGGTALRLLQDFTGASPPRCILQNAGNSAVAFVTSQLAKLLYPDAKVISLVRRNQRSSEDFEDMVQYLTRQGKNDLVVAEEDLYDRESFAANQELFRQLVDGDKSAPTLALNAVGGQSASLLLKLLAPGGTMVTYGGMSAQPVTVHTPQLIFQDLQLRGYWHSRWMARASLETKTKLCNDLVDLVLDQGLTCPPVKVFRLQDYKQALEFNSQQSEAPIRTKVVFDCQE